MSVYITGPNVTFPPKRKVENLWKIYHASFTCPICMIYDISCYVSVGGYSQIPPAESLKKISSFLYFLLS